MTELNNKINASMEMSEQELDAVAGGNGVILGGNGPQALFQDASTDFAQNQLVAAQRVSSNRDGSNTESLIAADAVKTRGDQITDFVNGVR